MYSAHLCVKSLLLRPFSSVDTACVQALSGGLVGAQLAPSPGWATMPVALMVVGIAAGRYQRQWPCSAGGENGYLLAVI